MSIQFINLRTQYLELQKNIGDRINKVLEHGQFIMGPEVFELEEKLAAFIGAKHCISASNGTDSLLIALMALGIGPGDEVITTPFSFIATAEMIAILGAKPVFVDIDPRTYNMNPAMVEAAINKNTKAIMPVSLYGQCADMDSINAIADKFKLPVIEDGAQSFGATYKGKRSCSLTTIGSTSFFPSKPLGCYGDGGALFTNDDELAKKMKQIRLHGQDRRYHHPIIGINGRLDTLQAAILLAKFERFEKEIEDRQTVAANYGFLLQAHTSEVAIPYIEPHNKSVYAQYTIKTNTRETLIERLSSHSIPYSIHYPTPLHLQPAFYNSSSKHTNDLGIAENCANSVLSLPMGPDLTKQEQTTIINALFNLEK
ncbi:DegT/DnrJ/EryC1/StrS family aminotransferase [Polynucleobacter sp. 15G-AUS-farblos]|uniref:DegT/DnrJ/EryC1/StrS family aminotransferase n=1 Tax=Polynucleobacter sp. 15G-AUS-farblos TaxID=2689094 RepID=UPI001C0C831C|nr:DegT/DnrJ/EryC1/StrS family aminotransferase [Polynucleobacter sp. 15G-AUS-farblos]MBU3584082.1 DegT/DnrJ/EryC1/StrS family aminotransferase [Polynucleobacter sp. 15G-AUS-farblos]